MSLFVDRSGPAGILGITALVVVGVSISSVVQQRYHGNKAKEELLRTVAADEERLHALRQEVAAATEKVQAGAAIPTDLPAQIDTLSATLRSQQEQLRALQREQASLSGELEATRTEFVQYRNRYRLSVRAAGVGEKLPRLMTRSGQMYSDVVIQQVNADGISFRHANGLGRVAPAELPAEWRERFQWGADEKPAPVPASAPSSSAAEATTPVATTPAGTPSAPPRDRDRSPRKPKSPEEIALENRLESLRGEVREAQTRLREAVSQATEARNQAASSKARSAPGSLETWSQRAKRLEDAAERLRRQESAARSRLLEVARGDPLGTRSPSF